MSLQLRLTLIIGTILMVVLALSGGAFYLAAAHVSRQAIERSLADDAHLFAGSEEFLQEVQAASDGDYEGDYARMERYAETCLRIVSILRDLSQPSELHAGLPLSEAGLQAVKQGHAWSEVTQVEDEPVMVYNQPVAVNRRVIGVAQVGQPIAQYEQLLVMLRDAFALGAGALLILASGGLWFCAGLTLRPLARLARAVSAIAASADLTSRMEHAQGNNEVGRLTRALNTLLSGLQSAYQQVEHSLDAQRRFVADASHELRAPLTTIRGNLGLLRRDASIDPHERQAILRDAIEESERMARLLDELLLVARAETGRVLRREPIRLAPLVEDVCRKVGVVAPDRTITCAAWADVVACGDADAVKQVLLILLDNAVKFTSSGGQIWVMARVEGGHALIHVRDNGCGIDEAVLPHVFERFYRGEPSRPGTGLGLSIARRLVEAQDGTISVASRRGAGTVFTILLPAHP
ncbi:MAG: HAMP domain-containing histidine kinase [Chloroflexi bacterium]|nr:HAMP domain-containing histidine kinase [Chloroflexota bacterium]